jgi:hypothetical protein
MVSPTTLISGLSATMIVFTGWLTAFGLLRRSKGQSTNLLAIASIFLFSAGSFYLGTVISFFKLLLTGSNLPEPLTGQLCYLWAPIGLAASSYVAFQIIKPKISKILPIIYLLTGIVYWYGLFGIPEITITSEISEGGLGLIDIQLLNFVKIMTTIYLLVFLVLQVSGYAWLAKNSTGLIKKKAIYHIIGYITFVVCGALDSMVEFSRPVYVLIVRLVMVTAYLWIYKGFITTSSK